MNDIILTEKTGRVVLVTLNRPNALNALNSSLMKSLIDRMEEYDRNPDVGCFILTGSEKVFAAGADIKELESKTYMDMFNEDVFAQWDRFTKLRTPKIAAVSGYALGGGCELAMMCDIIYASETAIFGQPELKLGVIPGMGGSQRLTKLIGKAKAMDMILTSRFLTAHDAERAGLVARVFAPDQLIPQAVEAAQTIANFSKPAVLAAREAVYRALELGLQEGILFERRIYHALWSTQDQREGMRAFIEKRTPEFTGQ